jgi:cobalamin biosynthesis protein CbiD
MNEQAVAGAASSRNAAAVNDTAATATVDGYTTGVAATAAGVVMCLHVRRGDKLHLPK